MIGIKKIDSNQSNGHMVGATTTYLVKSIETKYQPLKVPERKNSDHVLQQNKAIKD